MALTKRKTVRGSKTGRPIMVLLDLIGRRWTLRIIWELRNGPLTSRALRETCDDISPTVLQARVRELRDAGFVALAATGGYYLTPIGRELLEATGELYGFAERWARARKDEAAEPVGERRDKHGKT
jgi:DNA-binding HxlR family transcriptional regulator